MHKNYFGGNFTIGILGGGQLGCMLIERCQVYNIPVMVLDPDPDAPASRMTNRFIRGELTDFDTVYEFGRHADVLTIEIENINTEALEALQSEGVEVHPDPRTIRMVQDKGLQRKYYKDHGFPVPEFYLTENAEDVRKYADFLPAVHKTRKAGYDGKGVVKIPDSGSLNLAFDGPGILEKMVPIAKELSVIVARNSSGSVVHYPPVELVFHEKNLLDYLLSPADISSDVAARAIEMSRELIESLKMTGILAVELFLDHSGSLFINEIAPRPHNSGHQTIEASFTSQYEQHLRAILNLPFGNTQNILPAVTVNLLGDEGFSGPVVYEGIEEILNEKGVYVHLYGKKITRPFRKMGHITVMRETAEDALLTAKRIQNIVRVRT